MRAWKIFRGLQASFQNADPWASWGYQDYVTGLCRDCYEHPCFDYLLTPETRWPQAMCPRYLRTASVSTLARLSIERLFNTDGSETFP